MVMKQAEAAYVAHMTLDGDVSVNQARDRWRRLGESHHSHWRKVVDAVYAAGAGDTPGVPPDQVPVPRTDLANSVLSLGPGEKFVMIGVADYAAAGRVFKWLQGQAQIARRKIVG